MEKITLHIISLEIPYPPNKGSKIDIFYRIKALHQMGVDVILHAFYKDFDFPEELTKYCKTVYLIPRKKIWNVNILKWPLYVQSRRSKEMMKVLMEDNNPILFEGLHTLYHFNDPVLVTRKKAVRLHNIESNYYSAISKLENNIVKKSYYQWEAKRSLELEEELLPKVVSIFTISEYETDLLKSKNISSIHIPSFIFDQISTVEGNGSYILYHGDLSIKENENAAMFILNELMSNISQPLIIAGNNPSQKLMRLVKKYRSVILEKDPAESRMLELISNAQIILAPFSQTAGYKIKLLDSLAKGKHIITSSNMHLYTELKEHVYFAELVSEWNELINLLWTKPITSQIIEKRKKLFESYFNNAASAEKIINLLYKV